MVYRLLGINRGDVWVFGVYAPTEHFATFPAMLTHIFDPDIVRKLPKGILQKPLSELWIRQVDVFVH